MARKTFQKIKRNKKAYLQKWNSVLVVRYLADIEIDASHEYRKIHTSSSG